MRNKLPLVVAFGSLQKDRLITLAKLYLSIKGRLSKQFFRLSAALVLLSGWFAISSAIAESSLVIPRSSWAVIGPFDHPRDSGLEPVYPPEFKKVRLDASFSGKNGSRVTWKRLVWTEGKDAGLNFASLFGDDDGIAYAFTTLHSTGKRDVVFEIESEGQVKMWVNGSQVLAHAGDTDSSRRPGELLAGWNQILVKICSGKDQWRCLVKIEAMREESLSDISCQLPEENPSPRKAALYSALLPGIGHVYLGEVEQGMLLFGSEVALLSTSLLFDRNAFDHLFGSDDEIDIRDFLSNPPLIAATELPPISAFLAYRKAREKSHNIGYKQPLPDESLKDLASAPFDLDIIAKPRFFLPFIVHFGALYLLEMSMSSNDDVAPTGNRARDSVRVYGKDLPSSIGYPLGEAGMWLSFTAVSMGEETFFRGCIQSELEEILGKRLGWLTASALFGAAHYPNGTTTKERIFASLSAFTGGLVMGYFFQRDDYSLSRSVAYHTWWNFSLGTIDLLRNPEDSIISGNIVFRF